MRFGNFEALPDSNGKPCLLGGGGFGKTYKARHIFLNRVVALKVLHERFADEPRARKRFLREAQAAHDLKHPHIAEVIDFGEKDGCLYYAMEFCSGGDLAAYLRKNGPLPAGTALNFGRQISEALAYAHSHGLLHRDLKPANVMLAFAEGEPILKLIDFGLVKHAAMSESDAAGLTLAGEIVGTPLFASPEQLREESLDQRSDLFSLGMTLWFLVHGSSPIPGGSASIMAERLSPGSYQQRFSSRMPASIRFLLSRLLEKDLVSRLQNAREVIVAIDAALALAAHETHKAADAADTRAVNVGGTDDVAALGRELAGLSSTPTINPECRTTVRLEFPAARAIEPKKDASSVASTSAGYPAVATPEEAPSNAAQRYQYLRKLGDTVLGEAHLAQDQLTASSVLVVKLTPGVDAEETWSHLLSGTATPAKGPSLSAFPLVRLTGSDETLAVAPCATAIQLMQLVKARGSLPLPEAARILSHMALMVDGAQSDPGKRHNLQLQQIHLAPLGMRDGVTSGSLLHASLDQWPPFLACAPVRHLQAGVPDPLQVREKRGLLTSMMTARASLTEEALTPVAAFAALVYRLVTGGDPRRSAYRSRENYRPVSNFSKESNQTLARCLAGERNSDSCGAILAEISRDEGMDIGLQLSSTFTSAVLHPPGVIKRPSPTAQPDLSLDRAQSAVLSPPEPLAPTTSTRPRVVAVSAVTLAVVALLAVVTIKTRSPTQSPSSSTAQPVATVEPPILELPKPKFPKEYVFTKNIIPSNAIIKINGVPANLDLSVPDKPKLRLDSVQEDGDHLEITIDPPKGFVGDRIVIRITDAESSTCDSAVIFEPAKPKFPKEYVFTGDITPSTALAKLDGKPVQLVPGPAGHPVLSLESAQGDHALITIDPPPGFVGAQTVIRVMPVIEDIKSVPWQAAIVFERAKAPLVVTGSSEYPNAEVTYLRPLPEEVAYVSEKAMGAPIQKMGIGGSGYALQFDLPTGIYRIRLISANVSIAPYTLAAEWRVSGSANAQASAPPAAPPLWAGVWECEYDVEDRGSFVHGKRTITLNDGLQGGEATSFVRNRSTGKTFSSEWGVKDVRVDEGGNHLIATLFIRDHDEPKSPDETIEMRRKERGTTMIFRCYPAKNSPAFTWAEFDVLGPLTRLSVTPPPASPSISTTLSVPPPPAKPSLPSGPKRAIPQPEPETSKPTGPKTKEDLDEKFRRAAEKFENQKRSQ